MHNQSFANILFRILKALPLVTTSIIEFTRGDLHGKSEV
jgi:hypothetical protein